MPSFANPNTSFFNETYGGPIMLVEDPGSGSTIRMGFGDRLLFVNASLLSALTIWLPPGVEQGEIVELSFETGVVSLQICDAEGDVVVSAPINAVGPGAALYMRYISREYGWVWWNGVKIEAPSPAIALLFIGDTPPANPTVTTLWWDSEGGQLYIWYNDGIGNPQWVPASNQSGSAGTLTIPISIADGGTGATNAPQALVNLGALPVAGGTITGSLVVNGTIIGHSSIASRGVDAILVFEERNGPGLDWAWYAQSGVSRLWHNGDKLTVNSAGDVAAIGTLTATNGAFNGNVYLQQPGASIFMTDTRPVAPGNGGTLHLSALNGNGGGVIMAALQGSMVDGTPALEDGDLKFYTMSEGNLASRLVLRHNGLLAFGSGGPSLRPYGEYLEVVDFANTLYFDFRARHIAATGNISAGGTVGATAIDAPNISATTINATNISATTVSAAAVNASGSISAGGNLTAGGYLYLGGAAQSIIYLSGINDAATVIHSPRGSGNGEIQIYGGPTNETFAKYYFTNYFNNQHFFRDAGNTTQIANLQVDGCYKPGGGVWADISDVRTKDEIHDYTRGLDAVVKLNPVTFKQNGKAGTDTTGRRFIGLVANDTIEIMPEMVSVTPQMLEPDDKDPTELLALDATALIYALVNSCKELATKNTELEARILALENPLA